MNDQDKFRRDLQRVLDKHDAELEIKDHWGGYSECGQDIKALIYIDQKWDDDGNTTREPLEFDIGTYHKGNPARHTTLQERRVKAVAQHIWRCRFDINQPAECSQLATELLTLIDQVE